MILINNQVAPEYKNKELSGAGVTWQFCRALDEAFEKNWAYDYIDLCALSIISDMMGMLEYENQYLVREGLSRIQNKMFKTLIEKQDYSMGGKITPTTVAFYIVPLINAMIRVGRQEEKQRLYDAFIDPDRTVECHKRGAKGTQELLRIESARECVNAKALQDRTKEKMTDILDARIHKKGLLDNQILFIRLEDEDDFPATLNGLVAMSLASRYKKPTIVARLNSDGFDRGSARAPSNTELESFKGYLAQTGLFEYTAGHDQAFGLSLRDADLSRLHKLANKELSSIDFGENFYDVNFICKSNYDLRSLIFDLCQYEDLYGQQNPEPVIAITNLHASRADCKVIGKNQDTVRIESNGVTYIKFHAKDLIEELQNFDEMEITIVGKPNVNEWRGMETPQIMIIDCEIEDSRFAF